MTLNLNRRERLILIGAAIFIVLFGVFNLAIAPVFERKSELASELASKRRIAVQMQALQDEYRSLVEQMDMAENQYAQRPADFSLFSFLEQVASESGVKDKITYMRPSTSDDAFSGLTILQVEMRLQDITLADLAAYLFRVETAEYMLQVSRLSITKSGDADSPVNAEMRVESVEAS